jgi:hypothetical protein
MQGYEVSVTYNFDAIVNAFHREALGFMCVCVGGGGGLVGWVVKLGLFYLSSRPVMARDTLMRTSGTLLPYDTHWDRRSWWYSQAHILQKKSEKKLLSIVGHLTFENVFLLSMCCLFLKKNLFEFGCQYCVINTCCLSRFRFGGLGLCQYCVINTCCLPSANTHSGGGKCFP